MNLPEGWKLVPVKEVTPEMIEAALDNRASQPPGTLPGSAMRQMFEAMVEAAPSPPEVDKDEAYKAAWVDGFESRQVEIDSLKDELLREKNISLIYGPRPEMTVY